MQSLLIKDTTRAQREEIVRRALSVCGDGCDGCLLQRQEHTVIHIGFQQLQVLHNLRISYTEANSCTCQAIGLRQGIEFHTDLFRAREA